MRAIFLSSCFITALSLPIVINVQQNNPFNVSCINNLLTLNNLEMFITVSINGSTPTAPLAEEGFNNQDVISMSFFLDNLAQQPAQNIKVSNFLIAANSNFGANVWNFGLAPYQATYGALITFGFCDTNTVIPAMTASFSSTTILNGAGNVDFGIPAFVGVPTFSNRLNNANIPSSGTNPITTPAPIISNVVPILINVQQVNAFNVACTNNLLTINNIAMFMSVSLMGNTPTEPMGEEGFNGQAVVSMNFYFDGSPASNIQVTNPLNAVSNVFGGNTWNFGLVDDIASYGARSVTFGSCNANTSIPIVTAAFSSTTILVGTGSAQFNIPKVTAVPEFSNNLNLANIPTSIVKSTTPAPVLISVTQNNPFNVQCTNNLLTINNLQMLILVSLFGNTATVPMTAEGFAGQAVISMSFFLDAYGTVPAQNLQVSNAINAAGISFANNVWNFGLINDEGTYGAKLTLDACNANSTIPNITASFTSTTILFGAGSTTFNIPPVVSVPVFANNLNSVNVPMASTTTITTTTPSVTTTSAVNLVPSNPSNNNSSPLSSMNIIEIAGGVAALIIILAVVVVVRVIISKKNNFSKPTINNPAFNLTSPKNKGGFKGWNRNENHV